MPSINCETITISLGISIPNKARKYTKGLTQLLSSTAKIQLLFGLIKFFSDYLDIVCWGRFAIGLN